MPHARLALPAPNSMGGVALRNARLNLLEQIRESRPLDFTDLLKMDLSQKYKLVDAASALSSDKKSAEDAKRTCLYLRNKLKLLLRPLKERPPDWHQVQSNFCKCLPGVDQLLQRIGFESRGQSYVTSDENLSQEVLADALVDLNLLAEELSLMIKNEHPMGGNLLACKDAAGPKRMGPGPAMAERLNMIEKKVSQLCDLCGEPSVSATIICMESHCSKRRLCESCDARWHGHPDRRAHKRRNISQAVGMSAVKLLPAAAAPAAAAAAAAAPAVAAPSSFVRKVVSNSQAVSYRSQLGLGNNNNPARPQLAALDEAAMTNQPSIDVLQTGPPIFNQAMPFQVPRNPPEPKVPVVNQPRNPTPRLRPQQQPSLAAASSQPSESDVRVMKLNEFMKSLKPLDESRGDMKLPSAIHRPPTPEDEFFDCSDQIPQQPEQPKPIVPPTPKPRQLKPNDRNVASPLVPALAPTACPQPPTPDSKPGLNEGVKENSWECPTCTMLNSYAETKLLKNSRVVCFMCGSSSEKPDVAAKIKQQQKQQQPVVNAYPSNQTRTPDQAHSVPPQKALQEKWPCSKCTFLNPLTQQVCEVCNSPRQVEGNEHPDHKVKPAIRRRDTETEKAHNNRLLELLRDLEMTNADGRLAQLYVVETQAKEVPSKDGFQTWSDNQWPALVQRFSHEVYRFVQEIHPGVADVAMRPSFDDLAAAVLDNACDLETAAQLCAQRHIEKVAWVAEHCPELLQSADEVQLDLQGDLSKVFEAENERAFKEFAKFLFSDQGLEQPKFRQMNGTDAALYCRMGEFDLRKFSQAQALHRLMRVKDFDAYDASDLAEAAKNAGEFYDLESVRKYLDCKCKACFDNFPKHKLLPMASCQCEFCHECFCNFLTTNVSGNKHATELNCPMCGVPNVNQVEELESHFSMLLPQIKQIRQFKDLEQGLDNQTIALVEKKITEWSLIRDLNFRWCSACGSGLVLGDIMLGRKFPCPDCGAYTCKDCKKPWKDQHEGLDCEQFEQWQAENDPDYQEKGVGFFLQANGIQCPSCHFQYALAKGGCLHFTCRQCRYQFCAGCNGQFEIIQGRGLRCKHPRDCLFYLRDFGVARLQQLLTAHKVEFQTDVEPPVDQCEVMEQKEKEGEGLKDEACGIQVHPKHANLCEKHYIEYLVSLVNKHRLDPVSVMEEGELKGVCGRHEVDFTGVGDNNPAALRDLIVQQVPLGDGN